MKTLSKTLTKTVIAVAVISAVSLPTMASKYRHYSDYNQEAMDYAKVVNVQAAYETVEVNKPIEECWDERVPRESRRNNNNRHTSFTPEIFGAIIGAAVGNRVGKRSSERKVATVVGAVLGTTLARDMKYKNKRRHNDRRYNSSSRYDRYDVVQRCDVRDSYTTEERIVGYDVEYKYRGNVFSTRMNEQPGNRIRVKVSVNPV